MASSHLKTCFISPEITRYVLFSTLVMNFWSLVITLVTWFSTNTKNLKVAFSRVRLKQSGERSEWEYPFAVAGINVSFMLTQMLDLHSGVPNNWINIIF